MTNRQFPFYRTELPVDPAMKKAIPTFIGLLCLVALTIGLNTVLAARAESRSTGDAASDESSTEEPRLLPVESATLLPVTEVEVERRFTGQVRARRTTDLAFEGTGRVTEMLVDEGEEVAAGQVLGTLDVTVLMAQKAEVESRRVRLDAQLAELIKGPRQETIDAARAGVEAAQEEFDIAVVLRDRRKVLAEKGTISSEQFDTTSAQVKTLSAALSGAKARLAELENGTREESLAAQRGALQEVDASLAAIDAVIERTTIRAPFAGKIAARLLDEGAMVSQQMPTAAFRLVETGSLEAHVGIPREMASGIADAPGMTLSVAGRDVRAEGVRTLPTVNESTRTLTVIFDLNEKASANVRPGDVVTLTAQSSREEEGAWVPLSALRESARGLWSAFTLVQPSAPNEPIRVESLALEVLLTRDGRAFVRGTFDAETEIVASGAHRLVPGQAVRLVSETE